jgi:hypothetical protein
MDQAGLGLPLFDRVIERRQAKIGVDLERDGPAHDSARKEIQDYGQVDEAGANPDVGDVGYPHLVDSGDAPAWQKILGVAEVVVGIGRLDLPPAPNHGF